MLWLLIVGARAGRVVEVAEPPQIEVVEDPSIEGTIKLSFPGREGDTVYVDGWKIGALPVETVLAQGLHTFRIEGASGKLTFDLPVTPNPARPVNLVLSAPAPPAAPPHAAPVPPPPPAPTPPKGS